ncbi:MAG TPA: undecaprenyldiphospho-muramoylpentapeptide beta-N-acetylglucosaminyltransferase [Xanthobacteraceae bacterium]|nr:undecaprenyldiphospho-muramoylpentapeptide beta-N-acetylglucosaminyltransferase [Xanthobacteraceae bacterium]
MAQSGAPLVVVAAGGTGGHLFPAEALSVALARRGAVIDLATDERATRYGTTFPARATHVIPSATVRGRDPVSLARTAAMLSLGVMKAWLLLGRLRPAAVVGFGGYPSIPPVLAAAWRGIPTVIHEQNGVMGRANKFLSSRVSAIATSFPGVLDKTPALAAKATHTGNPVRPVVVAAAAVPYTPLDASGAFNLIVFGGSQGAKVMSDIVPDGLAMLDARLRARLKVVQQAREEDFDRVRQSYARAQISAEVARFFPDLPARIAASHLVISRSGASTVAELAAIGRPAILVPLPHALDQDQRANAGVLERAGGAIRLDQTDFTPDRLAAEVGALAADPGRLVKMAAAAKSAGALDAAERLADLVLKVASVISPRQ